MKDLQTYITEAEEKINKKKITMDDFCKMVGKTEKEIKNGDLDLSATDIKSLPDNLTVGGNLDLYDCAGITQLPDGLTVGGSLQLSGTAITSLPDNLTVGGYLDLGDTGITQLPDGLTVGGSLKLSGTGITDTSKVKRTLSAEARRKIVVKRNTKQNM